MPRSGIRSIIRCLATLAVGAALLAITVLPAFADEPSPAANADAVRQAALEQAQAQRQAILDQAANTVSTMPGVGADAPAIVINVKPIVVQEDVRIDASVNGTPDTVQQTSSNSAAVSQDTSAQAGAASASGGGLAISGGAVAGTIAVVTQINVEVVAGFVPAGGVTQDASNSASLAQSASASGGDATANGGSSQARGGSANAFAVARVSQFNTLLFVGTDPNSADSVAQAGSNSADVSQDASAVAGSASADTAGQATSGNARDSVTTTILQTKRVQNW